MPTLNLAVCGKLLKPKVLPGNDPRDISMDNPQATDFEIGWFAGIVDGEGWLGFTVSTVPAAGGRRRVKAKCELKINNCDEAIVQKAADIMRKLGVNPYMRMHLSSSVLRRPYHECATKHMATLERLLPIIRPHLTGNKAERADLMMRFIALRREAPLVPSKAYENGTGRLGARMVRSYTNEELEIIQACRDLQSRGASETTREKRDTAVRALKRDNAEQGYPAPVKR
jgi:hypothetical protein